MNEIFLTPNFKEDTPLNREIIVFIQMLATNNVLRFNLAETLSRFPEMNAAGLIVKAPISTAGLDATFQNDPRIMDAFIRHFSRSLNYTFGADCASILDFVQKVANYFQAHAPQGVSNLVNSLVRFLLHKAKVVLSLDITAYALTLQRSANHDRFFSFFNAYFEVILNSNDSFESVWEVCRHFVTQVGLPQTNDITWRNLSGFVHSLVDCNKSRLPVIREIAQEEQTDLALKFLYLELLLKIQQEGMLTVEEIVDWLDHETNQAKALTLLSLINVEGESLKQRLLDKLTDLSIIEEQKLERLQIYLKLLDDSNTDTPAFKAQLIKEITNHFYDPGISDLSMSLQLLGRSQSEPNVRYDIIGQVLQFERFKPEYLDSIGLFFIVNKDVTLFFDFLKAASLKLLSAKEVKRAMESPIYIYRKEVLVDFEREAVLLCTDSEGVCRLLGQELLLNEFGLREKEVLTYNINQLNALQQYKLVISLLNQLRPINHTIPIVLRLLDSSSEIVVELIACKLEELIPGYKYEVLELVKDSLPDTHPKKVGLLARLQIVWDELAEMLDKKRRIKEFDPFLSETEQIRAYNRASADASRKIAQKAKKEYRGISSMFKQTQVARAGGSVMPDGTVSAMFNTSVSLTIPRTMFIVPERNDYEMNFFFSSNWDKEFEPWVQTILSSGNI